MSFGVYVHIPYCLQKCIYCDFATLETSSTASQIVPPSAYVDRVKKEIALKGPTIGPQALDTIYFGGGTPSIIPPYLLISVIEALKDNGFPVTRNAEVTLEINPGTLTEQNFNDLFEAGFNRFSVGAQTFDDDLLKMSHRLHSAKDSLDTLKFLNSRGANYSADILFSLPTQTKEGLSADLDQLLEFKPPHVSPYCLTVPQGHPFSKGRAPEDEQIEMFSIIEERLNDAGLNRYEISNFSKPGFESRHNLLYWNDKQYWGVGLSSHSYMKSSQWGSRFWNPRSIEEYVKQVDLLAPNSWHMKNFTEETGEILQRHQALTDFFHTSLRMKNGLSPKRFKEKFSTSLEDEVGPMLKSLLEKDLLIKSGENFGLSPKGLLLSNVVFGEFTFLPPH